MRERETDMESSLRETEITSRAIGSTISVKDKALTSIVTRINFSSENGSMINPRLEFILRSKTRMLTRDQRSHSSKIHTFFLKSLT